LEQIGSQSGGMAGELLRGGLEQQAAAGRAAAAGRQGVWPWVRPATRGRAGDQHGRGCWRVAGAAPRLLAVRAGGGAVGDRRRGRSCRPAPGRSGRRTRSGRRRVAGKKENFVRPTQRLCFAV
jgi:hypothetical protein